MALPRGSRLGPYEIEEQIGEGGMGEVYRARDTRLNRTVAVKIVRNGPNGDSAWKQRLNQEARAVAALNHPNICVLHDVGEYNGINYLVMEYIEGETLTLRLAKGPLRIKDALHYSVQLADALDKAHRQGIIHRDLKPTNIMLTKSGAKLLDFGLSKGMTNAALRPASIQPTDTMPLTAQHTIVGTLQYMAPEQLEGKQADTRSDIFALGCVLYEMISGRPPFYGKSTASVVAAIMEREPATLQHSQAQLPTALTRLVAKCLAKDPDSRWQCAADLRDAVSWIAASEISAVSQGNAKPRRQWLPWAIASGMALVAAGASVLSFMGRSQDRHTMRFIVPAPPGYIISSWSAGGGAFISPDGRMLVFRAEGPSDPPLSGKLWLRRLELEAATPLEGTEGAAFPFWSPDSKYVGYFLGTKLMKVQVDSGQMQPICDAPFGRGGTWSTRNDIVFVSADGSLSRVSDAGGPAQVMMTGNSSERNASPAFLPDGRNFLFVRLTGDTEPVIFASSLDKSTTPVRLTEGSAPLFASGSSGGRDHIIFGQGSAYVAQEFDTRALRVRGPQIPLVRQPFPFASTAFYSTSRNGALAFPSGEGATKRRLMIYARHGPVVNKIGPDGNYRQPRFSPAGDRIAVEKSPAPDVLPDIWVIDVHSGATTRITTAPNWEYAPVWSADGSRIFFSASQRGRSDLMSGLSVGGGDVRLALKNPGYLMTLFPTDTSRDGRFIVFDSNKDILAVPLPSTDQALVTKPIPLVNTSFEEMHAALSPNGRWLAYTSNETGRHEVYVRVFQPSSGGNPTGIWPVSTDGGAQPRWRGDGKELFYVSMNGEVRATSIETGSELRIGTTTKLFDSGLEAGAMLQSAYRYDVTRDGQRFILSRLVGDAQSPVINVVLNWQASVTSQPSAGQ